MAGNLHHEWYGDDGLPVLVLSAGLGGLATYWEANVLSLAEDYRVLVYDHRGTGASKDDRPAPQTVEAMAADVAALLDELRIDEPVGFVGHALGGLIGLQLAMAYPGKLQRLMVVNGWGTMDAHTRRCFEARVGLLRADPALYRRAQPLFLYPPAWISEHDADLRAEEDDAPAVDVATTLARIEGLRAWNPGSYKLGTIMIPVMCLAVDDDFLVPAANSATLAGLLGMGRHASLASGGHAVNITRPEEFVMRVKDWFR